MVKIVISDNEGTTTVVPLVRDEISIGRKEGNTIRLTERNVSREHARLRRVDNGYQIADLDSYNGTLVNGQQVDSQAMIEPGDEVKIGDYSIMLQTEEALADAGRPSQDPRVPRRPVTPARLVMLGDPSAGAEFSLPVEGTVVIGRSEDLQIPINHRSVSREHAEIVCDGSAYRLRDRESANGITVNGRKVADQPLSSGDIIELGQVMFRYIEPGEHYFFDPSEAAKVTRAIDQRSQANTRLAAVLLFSAVVIAIFLLMTSADPVQEEPIQSPTAVAVAPDSAPLETQGRRADGYAVAFAACKEAIVGGRFLEAMAHAALALKARPADAAALSCQADAQRRHEDEQLFMRGKDALARGDVEVAEREFAGLADNSPFRSRPEVSKALAELAALRLADGRRALDSDPEQALQAAQRVLAISGLDATAQQGALSLVDHAKRAMAEAAKASKASKARRSEASARKRSSRSKKRVAVRQESEAPAPVPVGPSPMSVATTCLSRADNSCAIRALAGKANTPQEMALLIETYRAVGNSQAVTKYMGLYLKRFPAARHAGSYRQILARQGY